jgi:hypothetical protein
MRLKSYSSAVVLGFPIPETSNPFIAIPTKELIFNINVEKCSNSDVIFNNFPNEVKSYILNYWKKLNEGLNENLCAKINLESNLEGFTYSGLYAVTTSLLLYSLGKYNNEVLNEDEITELSRITDNVKDPSWSSVLDSLRYSSLTGKAVVYRNDEENSVLNKTTLPIEFKNMITLRQKLTRDLLGNDVYGSLTHLMGISVLEASIRLRESNNFKEIFNIFRPITDAISQIIWDLRVDDNCFYVPGLPNTAEKICI